MSSSSLGFLWGALNRWGMVWLALAGGTQEKVRAQGEGAPGLVPPGLGRAEQRGGAGSGRGGCRGPGREAGDPAWPLPRAGRPVPAPPPRPLPARD